MREEENKKNEVNCGCGCFGCLVSVICFVLICFIGGCEWARNCVHRCITDIISSVHSASSASTQQSSPSSSF